MSTNCVFHLVSWCLDRYCVCMLGKNMKTIGKFTYSWESKKSVGKAKSQIMFLKNAFFGQYHDLLNDLINNHSRNFS